MAIRRGGCAVDCSRSRAAGPPLKVVIRARRLAPLIDENTRAVVCETFGNPAGNIVDLEAVAAVAYAAGVPPILS
ncbi:hypothetical protein [Mycobacterium sp.]|uniref:hypothetical protein n=1 Tax=Mycobacterium sp. TaxID=1785 RepID=UPI003C7380C2